MRSQEASELFEQAVEILQSVNWPQNSLDERQYRDVISFLNLAISKAGEPFPRAHSLLARVYFFAEVYQNAWTEANKALQEDPQEIRAQLTKVYIAVDTVVVVKGGILGSAWKTFKANTVREGFNIGREASEASISQRRLKEELVTLLQIYDNLCNKELDADEYVWLSDQLITIADAIEERRVPFAKEFNFYSHILRTPLDNLVFDTDITNEERENIKKEVRKIRQLAEARITFFTK